MNNKRLATDALLMAVYCVLSILTPIKIVNFKLTFEAFPILVAGLLLGPLDGLIVGGIGSLLYQLLFSGYGITATTLLWVLPHAFSGLMVGLYAKSKNYKLTSKQIIFISIISALSVTTFNSIALYVDAKLYGYYYAGLVLGSIVLKIFTGIILAITYSLLMPRLLNFLNRKI